jgi:uncharacterized protein (UPF0297 family)
VTVEEFLTSLATLVKEKKVNFRLNHLNHVRSERGACPVSYLGYRVTGTPYYSSQYMEAGRKLGLSEEDTRRIALAADNARDSFRGQLLTACGVEEK